MTKKMKNLFLWMCCILFVCTMTVSAGDNLLMNGYFESMYTSYPTSESFSGFPTGYGWSGTPQLASDNGPSAPGSYAVEMEVPDVLYTTSAHGSMVKHHMPAEPGKTYSLSWDHKTTAGETGKAYVAMRFWNSAGAHLADGPAGHFIVDSGGSWVAHPRISAVAPAGTAYLDAWISAEYTPYTNDPIYIDNFLVREEDNLVGNGNFELESTHEWGNTGSSIVADANAPSEAGGWAAEIPAGGGEHIHTSPGGLSRIPISEGEFLVVSWDYLNTADAHYVGQVRYFDSGGGHIGGDTITLAVDTVWKTESFITSVAPAGTVGFDITFQADGTAETGNMRVDNVSAMKFAALTDLAYNGNFERGDLVGWGASAGSAIVADATAPSEAGAYAVEIPAAVSEYAHTEPSGERTPISAGESLEVRWDYLNTANGNFYAQVRYWDSVGGHIGGDAIDLYPDTVWKTMAFTSSVAPAGTVGFDITFEPTSAATSGSMRIDNLSAVKVTAQTNYARNGNFEMGNFTSWGNNGSSIVADATAPSEAGAYAAQIPATGGEYIYLEPAATRVAISAGESLDVSWDYLNTADSNYFAEIRWYDSIGTHIAGDSVVLEPDAAWQTEFFRSSVAPAGTASFDIAFQNDGNATTGNMRIDNISALKIVAQTNLAYNGNFETGDLSYWGASGGTSIVADVNAPSSAGAYAAEIPVGGDYIYTYPSDARIPISAGESLDVSWDYLVVADANFRGEVRFFDSVGTHIVGDTVILEPDTVWSTVSFRSSTAPAAAASFDITFQAHSATTGNMRVDNVTARKWGMPQILIDNHHFEDGLDRWLYSPGVSVSNTESSEYGVKAAQIYRNPVVDANAVDIRNPEYVVDNNDTFSVSFSYKTEPGTTGFVHALFRHFDSGGTELFSKRIEWKLAPTNGQWFKRGPVCLETDSATAAVDMWFLATNEYWGNPNGTFIVDNVRVINTTKHGDCDGDCDIDLDDLGLLSGDWLDTVSDYDFGGDGIVNFEDYAVLGLNWLTEL